MATSEPEGAREPRRRGWFITLLAFGGVAVVSALVTLGVTALLMNISTRKQEQREPFTRTVTLTEEDDDPAKWGQDFPSEYDLYLKTTDQQRTRYGGSEAVPRTPSEADPRSVVAQSRLEEDPRLKTLWAGYAFAVDFREERGHAYMLDDQVYTERQQAAKQPGTCIHCHASTWVAYRKLGGGDLIKGFEAANQMPYAEAKTHFGRPISCIDCHNPSTMALRVTKPGFLEGIKALKASEGQPDYDPNRDATRQEMRTFVCGQCHVEYYFKGEEKRLVYPWSDGLRADQILAYYDEDGHKDWVHKETGAGALKAQHPEFEMWNQGIHSRAGVACADCHMPYIRIGARKISDHHVRSPLLSISNACQTCHRVPEEELKARAETIQQRTFELRSMVLDGFVEYVADLKAARGSLSPAQLEQCQLAQRRAGFLLDFVEAENSMGFHAPEEAARNLTLSLNYIREGQRLLRTGAAEG